MTMPSSIGTAPPDRLVPLPRAMNGTRDVVAEPDGLDDFVGRFGKDDGARPGAVATSARRSRTGRARPDASAAGPAGSGGRAPAAGPRGACLQSILRAVWSQTYDPFGQPWLSTLCAALPVVALLGSLAFLKLHAHLAALVGLGHVARGGDPAVRDAAVDGARECRLWRGLRTAADRLDRPQRHLPVPAHGTARAVRDAAPEHHPRHDGRRLQLLLVAFSFGAFFEGAAGFGTPVAVTGAMLIGLGFAPLAASGLSLIANTAPVAFGALGHADHRAAARVTGLDLLSLGGMVGRQLPLFSVLVPFWLMCGLRRAGAE